MGSPSSSWTALTYTWGGAEHSDLSPGSERENNTRWDMRFDPPPRPAGEAAPASRGGRRGGRRPRRGPPAELGTYRIELTANDEVFTGTVSVRPDPMLAPASTDAN